MKTFLAFLAGAVLVLGSFLFGAHSVNQVNQVSTVQKPGATPGADINSEYYSVNGFVVFRYHDAFNLTGSTTCSRLSPNATSTLSFFSANVSSSSPVATIYELGTATLVGGGTDAWATTTLIGTKFAVAAQGTMSITGSTTPSATGSVILPPKTRVNFKGGTPSTSPKGTCDYSFTVL